MHSMREKIIAAIEACFARYGLETIQAGGGGAVNLGTLHAQLPKHFFSYMKVVYDFQPAHCYLRAESDSHVFEARCVYGTRDFTDFLARLTKALDAEEFPGCPATHPAAERVVPLGEALGALYSKVQMRSELARRLIIRMAEIDATISKSEYHGGGGSEDVPPDGDSYNELFNAVIDEIQGEAGLR